MRSRIIYIPFILLGLALLAFALVVFGFLSSRDRSVLFATPKTLQTDSAQRTYREYVPPKAVTSIIIGLHGFGDSGRRFAYYTAQHNVTDDNTLVVYPDAVTPQADDIRTGWNAGFCCGSGWVTDTDDVGFLVALIDQLKQEHNAADAQVFVTGFSNGSFMAQRLAAEHPDIIDGIAVSSGSIGTTKQRITPSKPVAILLMHGERDVRVSFTGGNSNDPEFSWLPFTDTKKVWQDTNQNNAPVKVITYPENAHIWDGWRLVNIWHKKPQASKEAADFFDTLR